MLAQTAGDFGQGCPSSTNLTRQVLSNNETNSNGEAAQVYTPPGLRFDG